MPQRIQLRRSKGWTLPPGARKVDRTTRWGNPFTVAALGSVDAAVAAHAAWMRGKLAAPDGRSPPDLADIRMALAGHDLACWCSLAGPCHADLLLRLANDETAGA